MMAHTHTTHTNFAVCLEQEPTDAHANEIWTQSRPRFVIDLIEQRQWIVGVWNVIVFECNIGGCCP